MKTLYMHFHIKQEHHATYSSFSFTPSSLLPFSVTNMDF